MPDGIHALGLAALGNPPDAQACAQAEAGDGYCRRENASSCLGRCPVLVRHRVHVIGGFVGVSANQVRPFGGSAV
jgi:hypothetical protein